MRADDPATADLAPLPDDRAAVDWAAWTRRIERLRRLDRCDAMLRAWALRLDTRCAQTAASFHLDGIPLDEQTIRAFCRRGGAARPVRTRLSLRLRNHVAILAVIRRMLDRQQPLEPGDVLRWYTSVSSGLCTTMPAEPKIDRIRSIVRRLNSPHLLLRPAVTEIAELHCEVLADELVPSFNGILARLLLAYQLGRCALPPVILAPQLDHWRRVTPARVALRLLEAVHRSLARAAQPVPG